MDTSERLWSTEIIRPSRRPGSHGLFGFCTAHMRTIARAHDAVPGARTTQNKRIYSILKNESNLYDYLTEKSTLLRTIK